MQLNRCRGFIVGLITIELVIGVVSPHHPAQAASGNGPYYAEPASSQQAWKREFIQEVH